MRSQVTRSHIESNLSQGGIVECTDFCKRFFRDEEGIAFIEFAIIFPMLLMASVTMVDIAALARVGSINKILLEGVTTSLVKYDGQPRDISGILNFLADRNPFRHGISVSWRKFGVTSTSTTVNFREGLITCGQTWSQPTNSGRVTVWTQSYYSPMFIEHLIGDPYVFSGCETVALP